MNREKAVEYQETVVLKQEKILGLIKKVPLQTRLYVRLRDWVITTDAWRTGETSAVIEPIQFNMATLQSIVLATERRIGITHTVERQIEHPSYYTEKGINPLRVAIRYRDILEWEPFRKEHYPLCVGWYFLSNEFKKFFK